MLNWLFKPKNKRELIFTRQQVIDQILEYKEDTTRKYTLEQDPVAKADLFGILKGYESTLGLLRAQYSAKEKN